MRVHVYKQDDGQMSVFLEPSLGKGRSPVVFADITAANVKERILPAIVSMRAPKVPRRMLPPVG